MMLNGYMQEKLSLKDVDRLTKATLKFKTDNPVVHEKRDFVPYKEERDHLGRLINSVRFTFLSNEYLFRKYVRRQAAATSSTR